MDIKSIAKTVQGSMIKHSPTILTGAAVAGLITTAVFAVRATPKALGLIDDELFERMGEDMYGEDGTTSVDRVRMLPVKEVIRITWRCYIPSIAIGAASIGCIIGAASIHNRRYAALASVYSIAEAASKEYQAKVTETIGKNKERAIRDEVAADHVKSNPPGANEVIFTGKGEVLCYDTYSGRYFMHDIEEIRKVENRMNQLLLREDHINLNELYYALGLAHIKLGDDIGWHINTGMLEFRFSSTLDPSGTPCLVIDHGIKPTPCY